MSYCLSSQKVHGCCKWPWRCFGDSSESITVGRRAGTNRAISKFGYESKITRSAAGSLDVLFFVKLNQ